MHRWALIFLLLTAAGGCRIRGGLSASVAGSGQAKTETRQIGDIDSVRFDGAGAVVATLGQPPALKITADDNLLPLLETTVVERELRIRPKQSISPRTPIRIELACQNLESFTCTGAGEHELRNVANEKLRIELSGAGTVRVSGTSERLDLVVSGAGTIDTSALQAKQVHVEASGAVELKVAASEKITGTLSGACSLTYSGAPKLEIKRNPTSTVRRAGD